jgi:hypothetical protein
MKSFTFKCLIIISLLAGISFISPQKSMGQMKYEIFWYAKLLGGYGNIFDGFTVTTPGPYGRPITARHRESHGNGFNLDISVGGTISRSKNVYKYSYFDFFALHRQLFAQETFYSFSGGGLQARYLWAYANIVAGYANSSTEVPNKRYEHNILGYGPLSKFCYGAGFGFNMPVERRSNLMLVWDTNILFPRAPHDDLSGFLNYTWFSTSLGFKYYISRIR